MLLTMGKWALPISYLDQGGNVYIPEAPFAKSLPQAVEEFSTQEFQRLYPTHNISSDGWTDAFLVEKFHKDSPLSRRIQSIDFSNRHELRFGAFNKNIYNTYHDMIPKREFLPYVLHIQLPKNLAQSPSTKICWKGILYLPTKDGNLEQTTSLENKCISTHNPQITSFYAVDIDPETPLALHIQKPFSHAIWDWAELALIILATCVLCGILIPIGTPLHSLRSDTNYRRKTIILGLSFLLSIGVAFLYRPLFQTGFLLLEGGNDGLSYSTAARYILESLYTFHWQGVFQGSENIYDLMPWHRYFYALNLYLFGETHLGYFLIICFFPFVIFGLLEKILSPKWSFWLTLAFLIAPIFESFGFAQFYMVRLCMRGFSEPLSYFFFLSAVSLSLPLLKKLPEKDILSPLFFTGLLFAFSVGIRPNLAVGAGVYISLLGLILLLKQRVADILSLAAGFSPILLIPIHNYVFGNQLVLFTIAAQKVENLAIQPKDYITLIKVLMDGHWPGQELFKIWHHLTSEVPFSRFWLYFALLINGYILFWKRMPYYAKVISASGLAQFAITFFYRTNGRYSYLHWTLLLLGIFLFVKEVKLHHRFDWRRKSKKVSARL